jgi:riboflavin kinase / FMN adenylyltransferase
MTRFSPDGALPAQARGAALALGNFDGVHLGHQAVLASARRAGAAIGAHLAAAVFEPHPRRVFQPDAPPFRLQSPAQRARALHAAGAVHVLEIRFDRALAQFTDSDFAREILAKRLGARHVSVGSDFRFGNKRMGDVASLTSLGASLGFSVDPVGEVAEAGARISSTAIRTAIAAGDMAAAAHMLTRPWAIEGVVARGFARGRGLGFPTANVALGDYLRPRLGVYAVRADLGDGVWRPGVASVGINPTVGALPEPVLEAHLFDFDADLYGRAIEVQLIAFLRAEQKFDGLDALKHQMAQDSEQARALLS